MSAAAALLGVVDAHAPVLTVLLPALTAIALLLAGDGGDRDAAGAQDDARRRHRLARARVVALASVGLGLALALRLALQADAVDAGGGPRVYALGGWPAPFGIVLVVDRLAAMMLVLTAALGLAVLGYAGAGWDGRGRHFHALLQFQLMGLNGAFVTGDLFNLFVFFEVLLIASYALVVHGQGRERLRVGLQYVVLNLIASGLFLVGAALVYAVAGTLNLADLALRVPRVAADDAALLQAGALLLLVVFAFKAALMPLATWLPATYAASAAPVAALFAIMTKVGVYAIVRVHGVAFGAGSDTAALPLQSWLLPLALLTAAVGVAGALAAHSLGRLVAWLTVSSGGTIVAAVGLFGAPAWSAGLYYLAHSTLSLAAMFLLCELLASQRGAAGDRLVAASAIASPTLLGAMLVVGAASIAGLPPLPGFIGKAMLLQAAAPHAGAVAVWAVLLTVSLGVLLGLARAGSIVFWVVRDGPRDAPAPRLPARAVGATLALLGASVAMTAFAAPLQRYTDAAARQLVDHAAYARAVLAAQGGARADTARPYRGAPGVVR